MMKYYKKINFETIIIHAAYNQNRKLFFYFNIN